MPTVAPIDAALADQLLQRIAQLNRWANRHSDLPLPMAQVRMLSLLDELGPSRIGDLARADRTSQPTATVAVDRLGQAGMVTRTTDPGDSRAVLVSLTPAGRRALAQARTARGRALAPVVDRLTTQQRTALAISVDALAQLVAALPRDP